MKKIIMLFVLVLALALTACTKDVSNTPDDEVITNQDVTTNPDDTPDDEIIDDETADTEDEVKPAPETDKTPVQNTKPNKPAEVPQEKPVEKPQADTRPLADIMAAITTGIGETPALMTMELDSESFSAFTFVDYVDGAEAFVSEPMMGSFAHSVVLIRLPEGTDANAFAASVRSNADPRKWICVEAEKVQVSVKGNIVLLAMSSASNVDVITSNFING